MQSIGLHASDVIAVVFRTRISHEAQKQPHDCDSTAVLAVLGGTAIYAQDKSASAQQQGVKRTELQRYDLSVPGREVIQVRVDLEPGVTFPMHSHPGEEIIYVLEGEWEYQVEGRGAMTLKAGGVLFIPAGVKHGAKNVGSGKGSELATYIVEKGKPLVVLAE